MRLEDITPVVLTFNESPNVSRCLEKLAWARKVVVLDSFSTDGTPQMAGAFVNVQLVQRKFDDHTSQWNHGVSLVKTPWVLSLDADYLLPDTFAAELEGLDSPGKDVAYFAAFRYCSLGKPLRSSLYPPRAILFRRDRCTYVDDGHTQLLHIDGPSGQLESVIEHDDRKPLSSWWRSQMRYADLEARHLLAMPVSQLNRADQVRRWMILAPVLVFFYTLVGKGLILDGPAGWYYVMQRTLAELVLSMRLMQHRLEVAATKANPDS